MTRRGAADLSAGAAGVGWAQLPRDYPAAFLVLVDFRGVSLRYQWPSVATGRVWAGIGSCVATNRLEELGGPLGYAPLGWTETRPIDLSRTKRSILARERLGWAIVQVAPRPR